MGIGPALIVVGALALGSCASSNDVRSTASSSNDQGEQLPPVDDLTPTPSTSDPSTTLPGTRPILVGSAVLQASDVPDWDVVAAMVVPAEPTWEALDCADMSLAWGATGRAGTRSRGTNGSTSFRNTAVEFATAAEAGDVLDAVDRIWTECTLFETSTGSFWSEPIAMPPSNHRTAGLVIGNDTTNWTLAYWQIDTALVVLEIEGEDMWIFLNPLLTTLSARLDGAPTPMDAAPTTTTTIATTAPDFAQPEDELPVIVPATQPPVQQSPASTDPQPDSFPPSNADWAEHPLAHLAPVPVDLGPGWEYQYGSRTEAEPADPDDAIPGCDAPVPPTLDGYELEYRNGQSERELSVMVGNGTTAESQLWIDVFRALAGCELDEAQFSGTFELLDGTIDGVDDAVFIGGAFDYGGDTSYVQVIGTARADGLVVAASVAVADAQGSDEAVTRVSDVLTSMLAAR